MLCSAKGLIWIKEEPEREGCSDRRAGERIQKQLLIFALRAAFNSLSASAGLKSPGQLLAV